MEKASSSTEQYRADQVMQEFRQRRGDFQNKPPCEYSRSEKETQKEEFNYVAFLSIIEEQKLRSDQIHKNWASEQNQAGKILCFGNAAAGVWTCVEDGHWAMLNGMKV